MGRTLITWGWELDVDLIKGWRFRFGWSGGSHWIWMGMEVKKKNTWIGFLGKRAKGRWLVVWLRFYYFFLTMFLLLDVCVVYMCALECEHVDHTGQWERKFLMLQWKEIKLCTMCPWLSNPESSSFPSSCLFSILGSMFPFSGMSLSRFLSLY